MSLSTSGLVWDSETSTLFNPAFCAVLLQKATKSYEAKSGERMPVTYAFLILPCALHMPTRDALPSTTAASMWTWLRSHPVLLMDFADRVRTFRSFTAAAIRYGLQHGAVVGALGSLAPGTLLRRPRTLDPTQDWLGCVQAAEFLGRWFGGTSADEATVLAQWGVRP
ncbi:three component ABC system middle component [Saccharopolyspora hattusasensis]|uniref:three component ABC system middle component n=1 Tax=Saccharopolyspora hattusasensis TaxID=1128679 RepID=UPI003D9550D5